MKGVENKVLVLTIFAIVAFMFSYFAYGGHIFSDAGYGITATNGTTTIANNSNVTFNGVLLNASANETLNITGAGFAFEWINESGTGINITQGITIVNNNGSTSGNYTLLTVYNLKNGTHKFRVVGWQSNISSENNTGPFVVFTVDSGVPTVTNLTTNNTNFSTATPRFEFNVTDNTATSNINITLFIDGIYNSTSQLINNWTNGTINGTAVSNGTHTFVIQAIDTAGNAANTTQGTFTVATPTTFNVTITSPVNNTNTTNGTTNIFFNLGSYVFANTLNYTVFVDRVPNGTSAFINNNTETIFGPRNLANGTHIITIEGHDPAGTYKNASVFYTVDQIAPVPTNLTANNTNFSTASPSFAFIVTDNTAASTINITLFIDGAVNGTTQLINNNTNGTINGSAVSNGTHTFVIQAIDPAGNAANTTQGTFRVSTPTTLVNVSIDIPASNNTNTTNVTQNLIFNSVSTIHATGLNYTVFRNGVSIASAFMNNNTGTTVIPGSANGTYTYYVQVMDPAGNMKNSSTITWTIDQIVPVPTNLTANNTNFSTASPSFAFNVTDNTAVSTINITLFIDGAVNGTTQLVANNTNLTISGTAVSNGTHTFVIQAIDPAGNSANTTQGTFTVATYTTLVNVSIDIPASNNTNTTNVTQNLIFNSVSRIFATGLNYTVFRDGSSIASSFMSNTTATTVIPGSSNGTHTYYVQVMDPAGNMKNSSTITWTIDQIKPVITNLTTNNSNFSTASPSFAFNVTDNTASSTINITLFIDGAVNGTTQLINNNTNGTINGTAVADGLHRYIIQAIDPAGNSVNMTQNSTFTVDTTVPTVAIQAPVNGTNSSSTIRLNFTHADATSSAFCQLELDSINVTNVTAGTCLNVTLTGLAEGNHTIRLWVNDSATNKASATVRFTVDTVAPIVSLSASKGGITIGSAVDEGSTITITCSTSDPNSTSSINTTLVTVRRPSAVSDTKSCGSTYLLTESGSYTITYTSTDDAGNSATATKTFSTSAVSPATSGGGGGGGGGGGSSTTATSSSTSVIVGITAGPTFTATVTKEDIAVDAISFTTTSSASSVEVKVENYASNVPSGSTSITSAITDAKVYQYLQISTVNLNNILKEAKVKFSTTKQWLTDNGLTADKVALYKFVNNTWQKMPTVKTTETSTEVNFEATVTSFSVFVIAGQTPPAAPLPQPVVVCGDGVCAGDETITSCPADCTPTQQGSVCGNGVCESDESTAVCETDCPAPLQEEQPKQDYGLYIIAGVIIFLIIVFYLFTKFRSSGYQYKPKKK